VNSPKQEPNARRLWVKWGDVVRTERVSKAMREMAYGAAYFDNTPDTQALAQLAADIERVDDELTRILALIDGMYVELKDFQAAVDKLVARDVIDSDAHDVFGGEDGEAMLDRLAALYQLDRHRPYRSHNGLHRE
jgi:hypothetical protein